MKKKIAGLVLGTFMAAVVFAGCGTQENDGVAIHQDSQQDTAVNDKTGTEKTETLQTAETGNQQEAAQQNQNEQQNAESQSTEQQTAGNQNAGAQTGANQQTAAGQKGQTQAVISEEEAKTAALTRAGIGENDTIGITVKLDYDDGIQMYEVDLYTPEKDYEYEIQALDGSILKEDMELTDQVSAIQSQTAITPEAAKNTILGKVQGAEDRNIRMKLELEDGRWSYEGKVIYNNTSYEYEMNAESGEIYEWSQESLQY